MQFSKYHAIGNDYIVIDARRVTTLPSAALIQRVCHRHYGVGSDGILYGPLPGDSEAEFGLRIFNPDGSEAQKSGNGLRIFCRYLFDQKLVSNSPFRVRTVGGIVRAEVHGRGEAVTVEMGRVSFLSTLIPVAGEAREVIREPLTVDGVNLLITCATIGNPHCVVEVVDDRASLASPDLAKRLGPLIESNPMFPERTNVQFLRVMDRANIVIEIWERGAGYTLASGSSSSAASAVAHRLGLVDRNVCVHMPGGTIEIAIDEHYGATMRGAVSRIADGEIHSEALIPIHTT